MIKKLLIIKKILKKIKKIKNMNITQNTKKYIPDNSSTLTLISSYTSLLIISDLTTLSLYNILINNPKLINEKDIKGEIFLSYLYKKE